MRASFRIILPLIFLILVVRPAEAQTFSLQAGAQVPLFYSLGMEYELKNGLALNTQAGMLTQPFDASILNVLELFGTEDGVIGVIGEAFSYGYIFQPTIKYHHRNYYGGVTYSFFSLKANQIPVDALEKYYGISVPEAWHSHGLRLSSDLHNVGLVIGREFLLHSSGFKMLFEFSIAKTVWSESVLSSSSGELGMMSDMVDAGLYDYYLKYGYLPSLNIFVVKTF